MPVLAALLASMAIHLGLLFTPGLEFGELNAPEIAEPADLHPLDAVLAKPAVAPPPHPVAKARPRPPAASAPTNSAAFVSPIPPLADAGVAVVPTPVPPEPAASEAVPPAPTLEAPAAVLPTVGLTLSAQGRMDYTVTRGDAGFLIGNSHHEWSVEGEHYRLVNVVETVGIAALFKAIRVTQVSEGEITAYGLKPQEFKLERGKGPEVARFDWSQQKVFNGTREDSLLPGTQDLLSIYYQLGLMQPSGALDLPIATGRKLDSYHFEVLGQVMLATAQGEQQTVHVRIKTSNDTIELWLAPKFSPLPLRMRIVNNKGEIYDQRIKPDAEH